METLRPKAAGTVLALELEKAGSLKWRAGYFLVIDGNVPRVMKPAEVQAAYDPAEPAAAVAAPARRPRRGGRPGRKPAKTRAPRGVGRKAPVVAAGNGKRLRATPEQMAEAKRLIEQEGLSIRETANALGMTDDTGYRRVWGWAKANGWESK